MFKVSSRSRSLRPAALAAVLVAALVAPGATAQGAAVSHRAASGVPTAEVARGWGGVPKPVAGWERDRLAPGADLYQGVIAGKPGADHWTVTVRGAGGAHLLSKAAADTLAGQLRTAGFEPRAERVSWPRGADRVGLLGVRTRVGTFGGQNQADAQRKALAAAGFDAVSEWTGGDGAPGTGLAQVKVAVIDPARFDGKLGGTYGTHVAGRENVSDMAARSRALLAVNAGFFVMESRDGVPGAAAGIAAYDGELQSAATNGRVAMVLRGDGLRPEFRHLSTDLRVRAGDASAVIDGVNRVPGKIRNCGGTGGDLPTERPSHDVTCTDPDEIVRFTDELGAATPAGEGVEAVLDRSGRVVELRPRGGAVPAGGSVFAGIGEGEGWLREHAAVGQRLTVQEKITDERGRQVRLGSGDDIVSGGPRLVRDGQVAVDFAADGIDRPDEPSFAYTWGLKRNPRTAVGVDARGRLIVVTTAGRQPGYSDGLGLHEMAQFMRSLGARQAMNLDGGGSSAMAVNGKLITMPSDASGERAVGDALVLTRQAR
ncbi:phosphodiester glycosidase family protein [Streptomyces sp. 71268]|uniref:phosphodiester glycosidase family protein n=1 Tax=Streptomyces sp. 71268 TaxID=3002640 RepID=UPI0023F84D28|nr:phosphodiester glycosidase family protein [Streptomyces sp. 71268]WEV24785.1 phosphodiester glycosidase family protein [Streptomyces sp. 71268]